MRAAGCATPPLPPPHPVNVWSRRGAWPEDVPAAGLQTRAMAALAAVWLQVAAVRGEWPRGARADGAAGG